MHLLIGFVVFLFVVGFLASRRHRSGRAATDSEAATGRFERDIRERDFERMVLDNSRHTPVLVDFYADWCAPCRAFSPVLSDMADACSGGFLLAKIDVERNKSLAARYGVRSLPTVMLFRDGEKVDGFSGGRLPHSLRFFLQTNGVAVPDSDDRDLANASNEGTGDTGRS